MRRSLAPLAAALLLAVLAGPVAAATPRPGTFAGTLGVKVPKGAQADVRAIDRATGTLVAARPVSRTGAFSLKLPAGQYVVVGTVVRPGARPAQVRLGVTLKAGQQRKKASLKAKKKKKKRKKARAAFVQEKGQMTPGSVAVGIHPFTGTSRDADFAMLKNGLDDLLITDVVGGDFHERCGGTVVEIERRADAIKELEFQQSPYVDPSTRLERNFVLEDVAVQGLVADAPGGGLQVTISFVDARTGAPIGSSTTGTLRPDTVFEDYDAIAKRVNEELCKLSDVYEVRLDVGGRGNFATHQGAGEIHAVLKATRIGEGAWRAVGPLRWEGLTYSSKTPKCPLIDPVAPEVPWSVTITDAGGGLLNVVWGPQGNDSATASIDCEPDGKDDPDPPPVPGMPLTALLNTGPLAFQVPYAGGTQAITGEVSDGGDGFFDSGTVTVKPAGIAMAGGGGG
ncbi:MAG: hypothetical protein HZB46_06715 [Solirubrobacterales bacterium]|nr:hypothetical protein [Solirubrobacterales bacterium]